MGNHLNNPHMEVEGNQTTGNTSIAGWNTGGTDRHRWDRQTDRHADRQTYIQTDIQTDRQTYRQIFFLLLFWGCGRLIRPQKKS